MRLLLINPNQNLIRIFNSFYSITTLSPNNEGDALPIIEASHTFRSSWVSFLINSAKLCRIQKVHLNKSFMFSLDESISWTYFELRM